MYLVTTFIYHERGIKVEQFSDGTKIVTDIETGDEIIYPTCLIET